MIQLPGSKVISELHSIRLVSVLMVAFQAPGFTRNSRQKVKRTSLAYSLFILSSDDYAGVNRLSVVLLSACCQTQEKRSSLWQEQADNRRTRLIGRRPINLS